MDEPERDDMMDATLIKLLRCGPCVGDECGDAGCSSRLCAASRTCVQRLLPPPGVPGLPPLRAGLTEADLVTVFVGDTEPRRARRCGMTVPRGAGAAAITCCTVTCPPSASPSSGRSLSSGGSSASGTTSRRYLGPACAEPAHPMCGTPAAHGPQRCNGDLWGNGTRGRPRAELASVKLITARWSRNAPWVPGMQDGQAGWDAIQ